MWRWGKLEVAPGFWLLLLSALVVGAGEVLPLVALAAVCHELGHLAALRLAGAGVERLRLTARGAELWADTRRLSYGRELLCTLAGPGVNLALALLLARLSGDYLLAGANLLQGAYNLLPLPELDGGRALYLAVSLLADPILADRVCRRVGLLCALAVTGVALALVLTQGTGLFLLPAALAALLTAISHEKPRLPLAKAVKTG